MSDKTRQADLDLPPARQPPRDSAKQRARRLPLDYYKGLTRLDLVKWLLMGAACVVTGGYVAWTLGGWTFGNEQAARQFSPAPVASVHAVWEGQCAACHAPGKSLRQDGQAISTVATLAWGHSSADVRCQSCHAGPPHHANQLTGEVWSCSGCHRDHQGRDVDLTRMDDSACTRCHADIAAHREGSSLLNPTTGNVTSFAADHPAFRALKAADPGRLKFNHRLHMLSGQAPLDAKESAKQTLADVPEQYRAALVAPKSLADVPMETVIQLDCANCHVTESDGIPAAGDYMQPINFEQHCAACHSGELVTEVATSGSAQSRALPHGLQPDAIRSLLAGLASPPSGIPLLSPDTPLQLIPGKTPGQNLAQTTEPTSAVRVASAEQALRGEHRCGKCHEFEGEAVVPTRLPSIWLTHARFDHASHRAMNCFDCHEQERLESTSHGKPPLDDRRPILPDIDNCRRCHAPKTASGTSGARHDCAECHRYHAGDRPPHGRGANERGVPGERRLPGVEWIGVPRRP
jgi:predicted CXXCH cytochrome family protein